VRRVDQSPVEFAHAARPDSSLSAPTPPQGRRRWRQRHAPRVLLHRAPVLPQRVPARGAQVCGVHAGAAAGHEVRLDLPPRRWFGPADCLPMVCSPLNEHRELPHRRAVLPRGVQREAQAEACAQVSGVRADGQPVCFTRRRVRGELTQALKVGAQGVGVNCLPGVSGDRR
jgi:hypothetical protein